MITEKYEEKKSENEKKKNWCSCFRRKKNLHQIIKRNYMEALATTQFSSGGTSTKVELSKRAL